MTCGATNASWVDPTNGAVTVGLPWVEGGATGVTLTRVI